LKCYCIETNEKFMFCIENLEEEYIKNIENSGGGSVIYFFKKEGDRYIKEYPNNFDNKEIIKTNFQKYGESLFKNCVNWEEALETFAEICFKENIDWIIVGSISEAVRGIDFIPHDIDMVVHVSDLDKIKLLFSNYLIEPFIDLGHNWVLQYFGRLCIKGAIIEITADSDETKDFYIFENIKWKNYDLKIKPIKKRYEIEVGRNRIERIEKIKKYMMENKII
jgi:hypothetical protein